MDPKKTGEYICNLRRDKQLTQNELAQKLGVTDKAISKWERGNGLPDITLLEPLAKELDTSVAELLSGESYHIDARQEQTDKAIVESLKYMNNTSRRTVGALLVIFGALMLIMVACSIVGEWSLYVFGFGIIAIAVGIVLLVVKKPVIYSKISKRVAQWLAFGAFVVAIILEALPYGTVLIFSLGPDKEHIIEYYSYFNLTPFGYANFAPLITAILTVALAVLSLVLNLVKRKAIKLRNTQFITTLVAAIISICPILYGYEYVTIIGVVITLLLIASSIFSAISNAKVALEQ